MIEVTGDLWSWTGMDAYCITTNGEVTASGEAVMGAGCALEAKTRWPDLPHALGRLLRYGSVESRLPTLRWQHPGTGSTSNHVHDLGAWWGWRLLSFPVKGRWRDQADLWLIEQSAVELAVAATAFDWQNVVLPRPGCGAGRLGWHQVRPVLAPILDDRFLVTTKES